MLKVGITGGIGAGKSTVAKIFEQLGIPVYRADEESRKLTNTNPQIISGIKELFGAAVYLVDGSLDRKKVAETVFSNPDKLEKLNKIIHPIVISDFEDWLKNQKAPFILKEAAIFFESGSDKGLDKVITVVAPENIRIKRVVERDGISEGEVKKRMQNQWSDRQRKEKSDFVIYNDNKQLVLPQVLKIVKELSK